MDDEEFWNKSNIQSFSFDEDERVSNEIHREQTILYIKDISS